MIEAVDIDGLEPGKRKSGNAVRVTTVNVPVEAYVAYQLMETRASAMNLVMRHSKYAIRENGAVTYPQYGVYAESETDCFECNTSIGIAYDYVTEPLSGWNGEVLGTVLDGLSVASWFFPAKVSGFLANTPFQSVLNAVKTTPKQAGNYVLDETHKWVNISKKNLSEAKIKSGSAFQVAAEFLGIDEKMLHKLKKGEAVDGFTYKFDKLKGEHQIIKGDKRVRITINTAEERIKNPRLKKNSMNLEEITSNGTTWDEIERLHHGNPGQKSSHAINAHINFEDK